MRLVCALRLINPVLDPPHVLLTSNLFRKKVNNKFASQNFHVHHILPQIAPNISVKPANPLQHLRTNTRNYYKQLRGVYKSVSVYHTYIQYWKRQTIIELLTTHDTCGRLTAFVSRFQRHTVYQLSEKQVAKVEQIVRLFVFIRFRE